MAKKNPRARSSRDGVTTAENESQSCKLLAWKKRNRCTKCKVKLVQPAQKQFAVYTVADVGTKEIGLIESVCEDAELSWIFIFADAVAINQLSMDGALTAWLSTQGLPCTCVRRAVSPTRLWKHCRHAGEVWIFDQQLARCSKFGECARWCTTRWVCTAKCSL